jgi:hypothetical protein
VDQAKVLFQDQPLEGERLINCTVEGVGRFRRLVAGGLSAGREFSDSET